MFSGVSDDQEAIQATGDSIDSKNLQTASIDMLSCRLIQGMAPRNQDESNGNKGMQPPGAES